VYGILQQLAQQRALTISCWHVRAGRKVAIEVDGPFHFSVNTNSPLGQTMIRRRLLRAVGWTVISVPYHTW
jgi:very-short-patch-repair endonuclease